ncbi:MAG: DUF4384 domain-containing protein [Deferribacterales bacterium]
MRIILIFALLLCFGTVYSAENIWVEAEGASIMGDADTYKETVSRAKNDALRNAVEDAVGVFIKSMSMVSNGQLADDLVYAGVRGHVVKSEVLAEGFDTEDKRLYRVRIKALIEPYMPDVSGRLSVDLVLDKEELRENDKISVSYKTSDNAYVYIFSIGADGSVTLIFPNSIDRNNYTEKGKVYTYPQNGSEITLFARFLPDFKGKSAKESVKIIATKEREDLLPLGFQEGLFLVYDARSTNMISDLIRRLNKLEPDTWTEATSAYTIVR